MVQNPLNILFQYVFDTNRNTLRFDFAAFYTIDPTLPLLRYPGAEPPRKSHGFCSPNAKKFRD